MSEQAGVEAVEFLRGSDSAFGALMDALAPEQEGEAAAAGEAQVPAAAGAGDAGAGAAAPAGGSAVPAAGNDGRASASAGQPADGQQGTAAAAGGATSAGSAAGSAQPAGQNADNAAAAGADGGAASDAAGGAAAERPAEWTRSAAELTAGLGELSTKLEERTIEAYQQSALEEVRTEHPKYFQAIETHPRLLVGQTVPGLNGDKDEVLRSTEDAREWQEAAKHILVAEIRDRASKQLEENRGYLDTLHASIELFQKNHDLVPHTKDFDAELAKRLTSLVEPYEIRVEGKLQGYSIRVQPIVDQLRTQLAAERQAQAAAAPSTTAPATPPAAAPAAPPEQPQAGITSKAGGGGDSAEDFSTLFGTIGLPDFQI